MPAGLQILNDSNTIQIDSDWANYVLVEKTTILSIVNTSTWPPFSGAIHAGSLPTDLIFVHCDAAYFSFLGTVYISGERRVGVSVGADRSNPVRGIPITFYIFRKQLPKATSFGMQVFDPVGTLVFDATSDFVRIVKTIPNGTMGQTIKYTLPEGSKYAVLMPSYIGQIIEYSEPNYANGPNYWGYLYMNAPRFLCEQNGITTTSYGICAWTQIPALSQIPMNVTTVGGRDPIIADVTAMEP